MTTQPTNQTVVAGGTATFTAAASGNPTPTVQWEVNTGSGFTNVTDTGVYSGSSTGTLTITGATAAMNGYQYEAVFTNAAGNVDHHAGHADRADPPPERDHAADQPDGRRGQHGDLHGGGQRQSHAHRAVGSQHRQRHFTNVTDSGVYSGSSDRHADDHRRHAAMNGYQYEAVFTNAAGSATTTAATLTVQTRRPSVTTQPTDQTVVAGGTATFTAAASGNPTPSVQWEVNTGSGTSPP